MVTDVRRWHLSGFNKAGELILDVTCVGETELNRELGQLERRPDYKRHQLVVESKGNRQRFTRPVRVAPVSTPTRDVKCAVCELVEPECLRRAAISGHDFTSPAGDQAS